MAEYKNQHYIQQAYLEGFKAEEVPEKWKSVSSIWVLDKISMTIKIKSIKKTASRPYYYSYIDNDGSQNAFIEKSFHPVEEHYIKQRQIVRDIITEINLTGKINPERFSVVNKVFFCEYVYMHLVRVPKMFDEIRKKVSNYHKELNQKGIYPFDENVVQVQSLSVLQKIGNHKNQNIREELMKRNIDFEYFPRTKADFLTSDSPVILYDSTKSPGLANETTFVYFPIDKSIILRFSQHGNEVKFVKHRQITKVNDFNYLIGITAHKEIYSFSKTTLEKIAQKMNLKIKENT